MPKRFIALINIPSPYRVHFFHTLDQQLRKWGWEFEVYFMAESEKGRYWRLDRSRWGFAHRFGRGIHPRMSGSTLHFTPDLLSNLWRFPPERLLLCGGWFIPDIWLATLLVKRNPQSRVFFWAESNLRSIQVNHAAVNFARRRVLRWFDGFVIPGERALEYLKFFYPNVSEKEIILLPNVVDESFYVDEVRRLRQQKAILRDRFGVPQDEGVLVLFTAARLAPVKGIMELLNALLNLDDPERNRLMLLIAGEGDQRPEIEHFISENQLQNVRLLGHMELPDLGAAFAVADGFILPSIRDPSPLAVVEAAFSGLPLLLSLNVGNHPELLEDSVNGWLFDPMDVSDVSQKIRLFLGADRDKLMQMGAISTQIAREKFHTPRVVRDFVEQIVT